MSWPAVTGRYQAHVVRVLDRRPFDWQRDVAPVPYDWRVECPDLAE